MNILLTGGTGFIGQRLLQHLTTLDHSIHILSRSDVKNYHTINCDFLKDIIPEDLFSSNSIDTVFHLAGFAHDMRDASKIADHYHKVNVSATVQLANLSVKFGVKRFVFVSSVKASGIENFKECMSENDQYDPKSIYGATKREAEMRLLEIVKDSDMHVSIIRPSLVYGPNVKGNLQLMLSGIKAGWFPPLPKIRNRRSMIHVDDLVRAILFISENKKANREIFFATDGKPYSSREIYNVLCKSVGKSIPNWSVPKFIFDLISLISPKFKYKVDKLLGDEYYSSKKLETLGFKSSKTIKEMNKTSF